MNDTTTNKRPISVTILGWIFIGVGIIGFGYHLKDFQTQGGLSAENVLIEVVRLLALISGIFMLRGRDWARWLAIAWISFHVVISGFHSLREFAMHAAFLAVIAFFLLRADAARYFRG